MALHLPNDLRDSAITEFRKRLCQQLDIVPLVHQGAWWAASDGAVLLDVESDDGMAVRMPDPDLPDGRVVTRALVPRPGGRAKVIADLGAFKIGKSFGVGLWLSSFACVPGARVSLVALEYDISAPEFDYICEFLLSASGMNMPYDSLQNRPRDGKMWLDLANGARFDAKSWERKDTLKGKEVDAYCFCEAYMLPGLECYTGISQNLRARNGYAVFPTTPDRPWLKELHEKAHSGDPLFAAWHCTCGVSGDANPWTFSAAELARDRTLMTKEKFQIHHLGQLGEFIGRVYGYQRGQKVFTPQSHPDLWQSRDPGRDLRSAEPRLEDLRLPDGWDIVAGADTGTFSSAGAVAFAPNGDAFVIFECPNYRYVAGVPELDESLSIPAWTTRVVQTLAHCGARALAWADKNSQFKREVANYGLTLLGASAGVETRTDIAREYFTQNKIWFAPWLSVLPFEIENAQWPEEASAAGKYARIKDRDHTLDWLEHILAKRPRGHVLSPSPDQTWAESIGLKVKRLTRNVHLGSH